MHASPPAKKTFAVLFLAATLGAAVANIACQPEALARAFADFTFPAPIRKMLRQLEPMEAALSANVLGRDRFLEAYGRLLVLQGRDATEDLALVRDGNGVVNYGAAFSVDTSNLHEYAARLYWLARYATGNGTRVIHVNPPDRFLPGISTYRRGLPFRNLNPAQDSFLFYIGEYGVHYLDARRVLADSDLPPSEWLFGTGDGWTPQAAFATFRSLVGEMERVFGVRLDSDGEYTDPKNYDFSIQPHGFLGDLGRMTGRAFAGLDRYTAIRPRPEGDYAVEWVGPTGEYGSAEGGVEETLLAPAALRYVDLDSFVPENFCLGGVKRWSRIRNRLHPGKPTLLLIHDKQGFGLVPFLAPLFGEVHSVWSEAGDYAVNINQYLSSNRFDYILVVLGPTSYNDRGMNFFTGPKE